MFKKVLIANRGEIACRVMATAQRLGIACVAVYSEADRAARHVETADEAYLLGPAPAAQSYLLGDKIIEVALRSGAEAVHPGYGFLSENAAFAEACAKAGLVFIGPPPQAIRTMGLKDEAKRIMAAAGVPVVPGYHGEEQDPTALSREAEQLGYPLLIKAVAGGGGKGMRRVDKAADFAAALDEAKREAASAFGDDRVLLERYVTRPRHIELQVFADSHGEALHLFERDCSLQRRHQKILEEAPAPGMTEALRQAMGAAAVTAAKAIGYVGAGTVEFIVDGSKGLNQDGFYFMEMNTRLQVEHPVTEMVTGEDLVAWQLAVAAGESLPRRQDELSLTGHAVEVRIYAEDADRGFVPTTGRITHLRPPPDEAGLRLDCGVRQGDGITPFYDPMIAKLIAHGPDRASALRRLGHALGQFEIDGCVTNIEFLGRLSAHPLVVAGDLETGLVEAHLDVLRHSAEVPAEALALAGLAALSPASAEVSRSDPYSPWSAFQGWRLWGGGAQFVHLVHGGQELEVAARFGRDGWVNLTLPTGAMTARIIARRDQRLRVELADQILEASVIVQPGRISVFYDGSRYRFELPDHLLQAGAEDVADNRVTAPLPGLISALMVDLGERVEKGQALLVLEAMKMTHTLVSPRAGQVIELHHEAGEQIEEGATLLVIEEAEAQS